MAASDETSLEYIFKRKYSDRQVADTTMRDHPRYANLTKKDDFEGDSYSYAMTYGNPQGTGGDFTAALAAASASSGKKLVMTERTRYGHITLGGIAMMKAKRRGPGAFLEMVSQEVNGIIQTMGEDNSFTVYRSGSGARGRIAEISGNVITLDSQSDIVFFQRNQVLVGDNAAAGTSPNAGTCTVTAVNRKAFQITVSTVASANLIVGDYLFKSGDTGDNKCFEGLTQFVPETAPVLGVDSFRGIDRGSDVEMLAGHRIDDTSETLESNIGLAMTDLRTWCSDKSRLRFYAHPRKVFDVAKRANAKVMLDNAGGKYTWGFEAIEVVTGSGSVQLISDPDCQFDECWGVSEADEVLHTLGEVVHVIRDDDQKFVRSSGDSILMSLRSSGNIANYRPAGFCRIAVG